MKDLEKIIGKAYDAQATVLETEVEQALAKIINDLNNGTLRVATKESGEWTTHVWIKQAIFLYFKYQEISEINAGDLKFFDKIPLKNWTGTEGVRIVPHALVRYGAFIESGVILMPSYVNIGAYVGSGTLVDTWATVGSCAQVGKNVHLSGGVGLGGVLEPIQGRPVIIEDNVFVGSRCVIVEGVIVEEGAVLGAGCIITASTKIVDVTTSIEKITKGKIPRNAVVIPGTLPKKFASGNYGVPCVLIIGERNEQTNLKTSLNDALRTIELTY